MMRLFVALLLLTSRLHLSLSSDAASYSSSGATSSSNETSASNSTSSSNSTSNSSTSSSSTSSTSGSSGSSSYTSSGTSGSSGSSTSSTSSSSSAGNSNAWTSWSSSTVQPIGTNFFADSQKSKYDGYQQAWRYLGWYVKCGAPSDRYEDSRDGESEHSHEGSHNSDENRWQGGNYCQRFLIWAMYIDENYQGGGTGEYQIYDPFKQQWDTTACQVHGNGLCKKMDCHETDSTNFKLLGVFKEASYFGNDAFFEQLFKHLGYCVWNDDDLYEFMSESRESAWTQGCVSTGTYGKSYYYPEGMTQGYLYIDLKPTWNGNMTNGLYVDSSCKIEYEGLDVSVDKIAANMGLLYGSDLDTWNDGMEVFKVCQPCRSYNLKQTYRSSSWYNRHLNGNDEDYDYGYSNPNKGYFTCADDADWTNVNQCMKFRTHAELEVCTWEDLVTATNQGGILPINISGTVFGSERMSQQEWDYRVKQRRSKLAAQAREVAAEAYAIRKLQGPAAAWHLGGSIALGVSSLLFLVVVCRFLQNRRLQGLRKLEEPLLTSEQLTTG